MDKEGVVKYLRTLQTAVLSTVDSQNHPHSAMVYFYVDDDLNFHILTKVSTQKYKNIMENNHVALTTIDKKNATTVQVRGEVEEVPMNSEEYVDSLSEMAERDANPEMGQVWPPPLSKLPDADIKMLKLKPSWLRYGNYEENNSEEVFHQIIP